MLPSQRVGCDGVLNSDRVLDQCSVCGGDNSTCLTISGEVIKQVSMGKVTQTKYIFFNTVKVDTNTNTELSCGKLELLFVPNTIKILFYFKRTSRFTGSK